ncbi:hypothetical protein [Neobacillus sp. Marseille-QA0830]
MEEKSFCKGCLESVLVADDTIKQMIQEAEEDDPSKLVSDEIYFFRLGQCGSCPSLQYGTTCAHCGCLVRYRAKFINKGCPSVETPRWNKVAHVEN